MINVITKNQSNRMTIELINGRHSRTYTVPKGTAWLPISDPSTSACLIITSEEIKGVPHHLLVPCAYGDHNSTIDFLSFGDELLAGIDGMWGIPDEALLRLYAGLIIDSGERETYGSGLAKRLRGMFRDRLASASIRLRAVKALPTGAAATDYPVTYTDRYED